MGKPQWTTTDNNEQFHRRISSCSQYEMNHPETLTQSEPTIQSRPQPFLNRLTTPICHSSSYKVSIGHETVNITEILPPRSSMIDSNPVTISANVATRKGISVISLCFMCFVCSSLILIALSMMHLLIKFDSKMDKSLTPVYLPSNNLTRTFLYMFATPMIKSEQNVFNEILPTHDQTLHELANVICLTIIVFNCFSLLVFSIEIYLGCNTMKIKSNSSQCRRLFSSSTARFLAICSFYASIPAFILVMCLFILMSMSFLSAMISLIILGTGLVFILLTLISYFFTWKNLDRSSKSRKSTGVHSAIYQPMTMLHPSDEEIDFAHAEEISTLV